MKRLSYSVSATVTRAGNSERVDDLRQSVGMPNDQRISAEGFQLCDQRPEIVALDNFRPDA